MGQKAVLVGFRKVNFLSIEPNLNSKIFLISKYFLDLIAQILKIKNILITNKNITFSGNICNLNLNIFIKTTKIDSISQILFKNKNKKLNNKISAFLNFIKEIFKKYNIKFVKLNFKIVNFYVNKKISNILYTFLKVYKKSLFERHLKFFIDFVQINSLFYINRINSNTFLYNVALIFSRLKKQKHNKFLIFLKNLFILLTQKISEKIKFKIFNFKINGLKFILKGKIGGKTRTKSHIITVGNISNQCLYKNIDFSKIAITTSYGVYGMKLWTYRSDNLN